MNKQKQNLQAIKSKVRSQSTKGQAREKSEDEEEEDEEDEEDEEEEDDVAPVGDMKAKFNEMMANYEEEETMSGD